MILLIDNYDSFVHNLARYVGELGFAREVVRNDAISLPDIAALDPEAIILSPGPCTPREAGISLTLVRQMSDRVPMLGVCLGHQAIAESFGAVLRRALTPRHGKASLIRHEGTGLFAGLPDPLRVGRYHSLAVEIGQGSPLQVTARAEDGEVMAFAHPHLPVFGVQFHPESVLTEDGHRLLGNFLELAAAWNRARGRYDRLA